MFDDTLERKNTFVDNKNDKVIKSKNWNLFKGVTTSVWS